MSNEQRMPNKWENVFMQDMMILRNDLAKHSEKVKDRLAPIPGGWRDLRLLMTLVDKTQNRLLDTVPDQKVAQLHHIAMTGTFFIEMPGPLRKKRFLTIDEDSLSVLMQIAMESECVMCLREGKEAKRCPLRQAMIMTTPPEQIMEQHGFGCEYRGLSSTLMQGGTVKL